MVIINGKFLAQQVTGVQRVATEIVKRIDKYDKFVAMNHVALLSPKGSKPLRLYNIEHIVKGKLSPFWEYTYLTKEVVKRSASCFSFSSGFPLFCNNGIHFLHDVSEEANPEYFSRPYRMFYSNLRRHLEKNDSIKIVTNSEFSKSEILRYFPGFAGRITVVYCGWEHLTDLKPNDEIMNKLGVENGKYFLTVAGPTKHKNLQIILEAAKNRKNDLFLVVGKRPEKRVFLKTAASMEQQIDQLENVRFAGYLEDNELLTLMQHARALIFPSLYEGFGLPALEAIYCNKPILLSDIPVFRELYGDVATFFNPHNASDLLNKIDNVKAIDPYSREKILQTYTWDNCVKKIIDLWNNSTAINT